MYDDLLSTITKQDSEGRVQCLPSLASGLPSYKGGRTRYQKCSPACPHLTFSHLLPALCVWYHRSSQYAFRKYHWLPERQHFSIGHKGMTPCPFGFPVSPPIGMGFPNNQGCFLYPDLRHYSCPGCNISSPYSG